MGSKVTVILSLISLGFLSMLDGLINNVEFLLVSRFLIGALFGISTSIAVSEAIMSRSRFSTSLTMSG